MCCPFSPGGREEPMFWRGTGKKSFFPLFQANDIHVHNNLMKNNFNIEIDHDVFNCNISPEDKKVFVNLRSNSINKCCSFSGL